MEPIPRNYCSYSSQNIIKKQKQLQKAKHYSRMLLGIDKDEKLNKEPKLRMPTEPTYQAKKMTELLDSI